MRKYFAGKIGMSLLGIWLVLTGLLPFLTIGLPGPFMSLLAMAAGVLILIDR